MFDGGVPEQFHQFIAAASRTPSSSPSPSLSLPLPLSFPLHHGGFDPFITHHNPNHSPSHHHHHLFPPPPPPTLPQHLFHRHKDDEGRHEEDHQHERRVAEHHDINLDAADDSRVVPRSISDQSGDRQWTNDEVFALLRIRSSMETWFPPEITWEQVSRKLAEIGFKRSSEKCKEKFEEQSMTRSIFGHTNNVATCSNNNNNNINFSKNNNYRLLVGDELEVGHFTPQTNHNPPEFNVANHDKIVDKPVVQEEGDIEDSRTEEDIIVIKKRKVRNNKRFEMFKAFCLSVVEKLMTQQEEMHKKLLDDMVRRDKEMVEREEAWKKVELERINKEFDLRAKEHAIVGSRQAAIVEFLKKFTDTDGNFLEMLSGSEGQTSLKTQDHSSPIGEDSNKIEENVPSIAMVDTVPPQPDTKATPDKTTTNDVQKSMPPRNPTITNASKADGGSDTGKRWPREEVLTLINLRSNINDDKLDHQGATKTPLWERISQGMSESGYTRSAKRCKEKWENINKYFRKTKDINANKKRSLESRTCPYFHQLSALYNQGKLVLSSENRPNSPESAKESNRAAASGDVGGE